MLFNDVDVNVDASVDVGRDDGADRVPLRCELLAVAVVVDVDDDELPLVPRS